jgi:hypothetical protein
MSEAITDRPAAMIGHDFALAEALPPALLYRRCDPAELPFTLCSELDEAPGLIGQERAVEALDFAVRIRGKGYNVYALGAGGTGRHPMIADLLRQKAASRPTPPDWCYVNNLDDPQQPRRLHLPPGRGATLAAAMKRLVDELRAALPAAFDAAAQIAAASERVLVVVSPPSGARTPSFDKWIDDRLQDHPVRLQIEIGSAEPAEPAELRRRLGELDCRLLAVEASIAKGGSERLRELVDRFACDILVVR